MENQDEGEGNSLFLQFISPQNHVQIPNDLDNPVFKMMVNRGY